ncbi:MAG: YheC/YheD family protein [Gorillibacterium sp.]|nr:YheC/YheD family protein [Gorillibacterium sp.]
MSLTPCTILITRQEDSTIAFTRSLGTQLQLSPNRTCTLRIGSRSVTVSVKPLNRRGNFLAIPASIATILKLPNPGKCLIKVEGRRELRIGPLIGIMTSISNDPALPFGGRTSFIRDIIDAGKEDSFFFGFSPRSVNWDDETVTGYFRGTNGGWVRRTVPLPDVVYNRFPNRGLEKTAEIRQLKEEFVNHNIPFFNWGFFDKWDVYRLLDGDKDMSPYVPDTELNPTADDIQQMLERHRFLYLKPSAGSLGFGIYRLTYNPGKGYFLRFRKDNANVLMRFPRFQGLMQMLKRQKIRMSQYVIQQGIRLIELDGCPIDFRFHLTKDGANEWVVSGIGAKKAGRGSVTTHVRTGGQLMTPEQVLVTTHGDKGLEILEKAKDTSIKLAKAIEKAFPHRLGELGLDLGIDQDENIWMFEANSKPGRTIFKHPLLKSQGKDASTNLFEHCLYLSRFTRGGE